MEIQPIVTDLFRVLMGTCTSKHVIPKVSFTIPQQMSVTMVNVRNFQKAES